MMVCSVEDPELPKVLSFKPESGPECSFKCLAYRQETTLSFLISAFAVYSTSFSPNPLLVMYAAKGDPTLLVI